MYKKILAAGGIASSLLFIGAQGTFAQTGTTTNDAQPPMFHKGTHHGGIHRPFDPTMIATQLGLNADEVKQELANGKTFEQILQEHSITKEQVAQKLAQLHPEMKENMQKHLDAALDTLAPKLGLNADEVRAEIKAGKTFKQILDEHGITKEQMQGVFGGMRPHHIMKGQMSDTMLQIQANVLGITIDQLKQAFNDRKPLPQIVQAQGMTMDQFREKVVAELQQQLDNGTVSGNTATMFQHMIDRMSHTFHP